MRKRRDDYKETTYSQAVYIKFYLSPSKGKKIVFAPQTFLLRLVRRHMSMRVTSGFRTSGMLVVLRVVAVVVRPVAVVAAPATPTDDPFSSRFSSSQTEIASDEASSTSSTSTPVTYALISAALVMVAGTMAGLTVGLLGIDPIELELRAESEVQSADRDAARSIRRVTSKHHWLLCTLLLVNAFASEALPLCLNQVVGFRLGLGVSVVCVLLFGEILPSALFTGPRRVRLAAKSVPFVNALMWVTSPISWPLAYGLDKMIGQHSMNTRLNRSQIGTLIGLHREEQVRDFSTRNQRMENSTDNDDNNADDRDTSFDTGTTPLLQIEVLSNDPRQHTQWWRRLVPQIIFTKLWMSGRVSSDVDVMGPSTPITSPFVPASPPRVPGTLSDDEVTIVRETLRLAGKTVSDAMTPFPCVYMLPFEGTVFDENMLASTLGTGLSRIPVFRKNSKHNVVGTLMVKKLIVLDPNSNRHLSELPLRKPLLVHPNAGLLETLNAFQRGKSHLALVTEHGTELQKAWALNSDVSPGSVTISGIITVEDILEELIGKEITDEDDSHCFVNFTEFGKHERRDSDGKKENGAASPLVLTAARKFKSLLNRRNKILTS